MKRLRTVLLVLAFFSFTAFNGHADNAPLAGASTRVLERGQHYKVTETLRQSTNSSGQTILTTNRFKTIQNGLNFRDAGGNWIDSKPVVQVLSSAVVCTGASFQVIIATNLNMAVAIDLQTCDKERIVLRPAGIGFYDPDSGQSVLLAQVRDCMAEVVSNKVVFANAFVGSGINGSVP